MTAMINRAAMYAMRTRLGALESAALFVCPLRFGAGVKNKILAALAMGKPVVATRVSLEGLDLREDHDLLVGDDPAGFADKVIRLLNDRDFAEELGRNGQRSVKERYSWQVSGQALDDALHTLIRSTTSTVAL
jgi:polysaccharide biosynthesis protein PslH